MSDKQTNNIHISEGDRCLHCAKASCRDACPIHNDIPSFLQLARDGKFDEAVQLIGHPFGGVCGFVCPHDKQCQGGCVLSKRGQAVKMGEVERLVFQANPYKLERKGNEAVGLKVAVVGGGVTGLTAAVKLYEQGASVTVYERDELLSTLKLIPQFRLPREEIARIEQACCKLKVVKEDITAARLAELRKEFDVVYIATGASKIYGLGIDGAELATAYDEFLKSSAVRGKVVVIGGGNTAMDCARKAKRNGCEVTVAYRRTREDMPAFSKEIEEADSEGVIFKYNLAPVKLEQSNGQLLLTLARTVSVGRGELTVTEETTQIVCDVVVAALGSAFDKALLGATDVDKVSLFIGGDAVSVSTVANAVADGLNVAKQIITQYKKSR